MAKSVKSHVTPEQVKATAAKVLAMLSWIVALTPNQLDNRVVAALSELNNQPWFSELVASVINMFDTKNGTVDSYEVEEHVTGFLADLANLDY